MGGGEVELADGAQPVLLDHVGEGDDRLQFASYRGYRVVVLAAGAILVVAVSMAVTAASFTPAAWPLFVAAALLIGVIYAALGALAGALLDKLAATYLMLFLVLTDLGIAQNPMFGNGTPRQWAALLPGFGPGRVMVDGAFSPVFHATGALVIAVGWAAALTVAVSWVLRRAVGMRP